jgi:hypothetical protein
MELQHRYVNRSIYPAAGPKTFFEPYEQNLITILEDKGIKMMRVDMDSLRTNQSVIDAIHDLDEHQKAHRSAGAKSYEANLHDAVLWEYARQNRPSSIDSPADAGVWICTLDYGLIGFDRRMRRDVRQPPICLLPSALIQLIQFWAPRSDVLDAALVSSMREPLLFLDFDRDAERVTTAILGALSRFENVDDMSQATMFKVLSNNALRSRIETGESRNVDQNVVLVREAIIEETANLERQKEALEEQNRALDAARDTEVREKESELEEIQRRLSDSTRTAAGLQSELTGMREELGRAQDDRSSMTEELRQQRERLENAETGRENAAERARQLRRMAVISLVSLLVLFGIAAAIASVLQSRFNVAAVAWATTLTIAFFAWLLVVEVAIERSSHFQGLRTHRSIRWGRRIVGGLILAILAGVLTAGLLGALGKKHPSVPRTTPTSSSTARQP